jgi:hypothetical protein
MSIEERAEKIERLLAVPVERQTIKDWYDIAELARLVGKAELTVPEWARLGRLRAEKRQTGLGADPSCVVSHRELLRYRREGLLPLQRRTG